MSEQPLFSPHWYRVRDVSPWLARDVEVHRHVYRGEGCYVLHRPSTGTHHKLSVEAFELVDQLDGELTVDGLWQQALSHRDSDAPTQQQLLNLLGSLHEADLLVVNQRLDTEQLFTRQVDTERRERRSRLLNPLYMRLSLLDPDSWLDRALPLSRALFSHTAGIVCTLLVAIAVLLVIPSLDDLVREVSRTDLLSPRYIMLFLVLYPLLKLGHELAHALAVKRWGGEVHELGIALMVLLPIPYVDASASSVFADKRKRMLVDSAGMLFELIVAAIAALVWLVSTGTLHQLALMIMVIGGLSTLVFNGNPLLKFDGYYLLSDWLEIPNLAERARRRVGAVLRHRLLAQEAPEALSDAAEGRWLVGYGFASAVYRVVLMLSIAWMLSGRFFVLGVMLGLWAVVTGLLLPALRGTRRLLADTRVSTARATAWLIIPPALLLLAASVIPLPLSTSTTGVVWLPDEAVVRSASDCEVVAMHKRPGERVKAGDPLFDCEDPVLETRLLSLQAQDDELGAEAAGLAEEDPVEYARLGRERNSVARRLDDARSRMHALQGVAAVDGRFDIEGDASLVGRFLEAGSIAAYVVPDQARTVRVALDEAAVTWLDSSDAVRIRVAGPDRAVSVYPTRVIRQTPEATLLVPSSALSTRGGGRLQADPSGDGRQLLTPAFDLELDWPESVAAAPIGSHVQVRFEHAMQPLAHRLKVRFRRAVMGRLDA